MDKNKLMVRLELAIELDLALNRRVIWGFAKSYEVHILGY